MRKLIVFNHVSLDGYFVDAANSMMWAKTNQQDAEWNDFVARNASGESPLLFGRITYELMVSYWPTPMAKQHNAALAERMNNLAKIVFSRTLDKVSWKNTRLVKTDMLGETRKMKQEPGEGMVILGSGSIVSQLAAEGLIDEFQVVMNPIVLGKGRTMFEGLKQNLNLTLTNSRVFKNGNVFLCYQPCS
jgi:dihydrofolate reductase